MPRKPNKSRNEDIREISVSPVPSDDLSGELPESQMFDDNNEESGNDSNLGM